MVDRVSLQSATAKLEQLIETGSVHQAIVLPVNSLMHGRRDRRFLDICNHASIVLPDGVPLLWASRLLGAPIPGRVAGSDLLWELSAVAERRGYSCFLLGSTTEVLSKLVGALLRGFPCLRLVGSFAPPVSQTFPAEVNDDIVRRVNAARPDILWVGLGAPRQELWIHDNLMRLDTRLAIGVGAAFDICSGTVRRASPLMQRAGLEWFHRFILEPRRLFRRYFVEAAPFLPLVLWQRVRHLSRCR
ncbi:MAG TPA: WecB/TagA/CpsF family glycosyltransferase [Spirochaetia bacterium]|nr:WecB/TagA/CpsF family glycosyltransferase [Spirochaetia bacterium]